MVATLGVLGTATPAVASTTTPSSPRGEVGTTITTASAEHYGERTLQGTWDAEVRTTIPSEGESTLTFLADGTLGPPDSGTWKDGPHGTFTFDLRYTRYDEDGTVIGHTEGHQQGRIDQHGLTFRSAGTTEVYDLEGNVVQRFDLFISATRAED
ncbi:hypothetical protein [Saccharomonospora saliphila]|uniref:hypothetical protein n=1 Tax=Saccharomonospora saliphila TaxID=369829 RepID=UPI0003688E48|nr:hypothetical protein [Saccharomonospora saliphila]